MLEIDPVRLQVGLGGILMAILVDNIQLNPLGWLKYPESII